MTPRSIRSLIALLVLVTFAAPLRAAADDAPPENVHLKVLTPAEAAAGLRVFRYEGDGPMDREKMAALMNRALDQLATPDGTIESASGDRVTIVLSSGEKLSLQYDETTHSWGGDVFVVVLPE